MHMGDKIELLELVEELRLYVSAIIANLPVDGEHFALNQAKAIAAFVEGLPSKEVIWSNLPARMAIGDKEITREELRAKVILLLEKLGIITQPQPGLPIE